MELHENEDIFNTKSDMRLTSKRRGETNSPEKRDDCLATKQKRASAETNGNSLSYLSYIIHVVVILFIHNLSKGLIPNEGTFA